MFEKQLDWNGKKIEIKRQRNYRGLSIFVHPNKNIVIKSAITTSKKQLLSYLCQNTEWILKQLKYVEGLQKRHPQKQFVEGEELPFLGRLIKIRLWEKRKHQILNGVLWLPQNKPIKDLVRKVYRLEAEKLLLSRTIFWQQKMNLRASSVKVRDYKARWGSCSHDKKVSFNWKLMAAPLSVIDYVIIHELSHLVHMNHSRNFWMLVEEYCLDYKQIRSWLKKNSLHFDFLDKKSQLYN